MYEMASTTKKTWEIRSCMDTVDRRRSVTAAGDECRSAGVANPRGLVSKLSSVHLLQKHHLPLLDGLDPVVMSNFSICGFKHETHRRICNAFGSNQLALPHETRAFAHDYRDGVVDHIHVSLTLLGALISSIGNASPM